MESQKLTMAQRLELWRASKEQQQQQQQQQQILGTNNGVSLLQNSSMILTNRKSLSSVKLTQSPSSETSTTSVSCPLSIGKRKILNSPKGHLLIDLTDIENKITNSNSNDSEEQYFGGIYKSPYSEKLQGNSPLNMQKNKQRRKSMMIIHDRNSYGQNQNKDPNIMDSISLFSVGLKPNVDNNVTPNTLVSGLRHSPNSAISDRLNSTLDDGYITASEHAPYDDYYDSDSRSSIGSNRPNNMSSPCIMNNNSRSSVSTSRASLGKKLQTCSPNAVATIHKAAMQQARDEIDLLGEKVVQMEEKFRQAEIDRDLAINNEREQKIRLEMAIEEINSLTFYNSLQDQKILEMEHFITQDRMEQNENNSNRSRKHKAEIKILKAEREEYEQKANEMIQQMQEQMSLLQTMAMNRIEELEKDLLAERRKNETLSESKENTRSTSSIKYSAIHKKYTAAVEYNNEEEEGEEDDDDDNDDNNNDGGDDDKEEDDEEGDEEGMK